MLEGLPERVEPFQLAEKGCAFKGRVALSRMARLGPLLHSNEGSAEVELVFSIDDQGIRRLQGTVHARVEMICQRCLKPMEVPVDAKVSLGLVVDDGEAALLPRAYDPLLVTEASMSLSEIVEDELILALPAVAVHDERAHCAAPSAPDSGNGNAPHVSSPFEMLSVLKKDG